MNKTEKWLKMLLQMLLLNISWLGHVHWAYKICPNSFLKWSIISAYKEQLTTFASHANQTHPSLVEMYIRLVTSLCFFKIDIRNHTSHWCELRGKAGAIIKQMLIEPLIPYLGQLVKKHVLSFKNYKNLHVLSCWTKVVLGNWSYNLSKFYILTRVSSFWTLFVMCEF